MGPQTRYARSGDVRIAYQVVGEGPLDLVYVPGFVSNVEEAWEIPAFELMFRFLSSFTRLIIFDKRGTGLSDPVSSVPTLEERMDDVRAVMDAAESERAAIFGVSEGGPMAILFAATFPDRTTALILHGTGARLTAAPDFPFGRNEAFVAELISNVDEYWGQAATLPFIVPSFADDPVMREQWARWERTGASPSMAIAVLESARTIDVRDVLPAITVPTLVTHSKGDPLIPVELGRYLAENIRGAKYLELPGIDHSPLNEDGPPIMQAIYEFLTGVEPVEEFDRVLATLVMTDIVGSTETVSRIGDARWRSLLDQHDRLVRRQLERFRGREVKSLGDGFLATFDGPGRALRCATAVLDAAARLGLTLRIGAHTGEVETRGDDVGGIAVHICSRIAELAEPGEILVSSTVKDLVTGSGLSFEDRGSHLLKGTSQPWQLFSMARPSGVSASSEPAVV